MKLKVITSYNFVVLLSFYSFFNHSVFAQTKTEECQKDLVEKLAPNVRVLLDPICDRSKDVKKLVKVNKEESVDYVVDLKKLSNGHIQLSTELMGPKEFNKSPLKVLDREGFTDKGVVLISKIAFLLPNKPDSFYSLEHQKDTKYLETCLYRTKINLTDDMSKENYAKGIVPLIKTVKIDKIPTVMDALEDPVAMEARLSLQHYDKQLSEGLLADSQSENHQVLKDLRVISKSEDKDLGEPTKVMLLELGKADRAIHGSRITNEYYSLGEKDGRTLVVIRQILSLNISLPGHKKITNMINELLQNDFGILNPKRLVKNIIKGKIIDRTNYESGLTIETMRTDGLK